MKDATVIVIGNPHQGDAAVENVLSYMIDSPFADDTEILANAVRCDCIEHMVEDIYRVQSTLDMENHRRLFHIILSARQSKVSQDVVESGAYALLEYFHSLGHQAVLVPHYGSAQNPYHFHYHVAVNPINYINGSRLLDKYATFNAITEYLNLYTSNNWRWKRNNSAYSHTDGWSDR